MIPNVAQHFLTCLYAKQPFFARPCESHCLYLTVIFDVMKRPLGAHCQEKLWSMAVHHLLDLDVNIHAQHLNRSANLGRDVEGVTIFSCDLDEATKAQMTADPKSRQLTQLLTVMDAMMELMFSELAYACEWNFDLIWQIMMQLLDGLLIATEQAQFTHFIIFYLAEKKPDVCVRQLTMHCLEKVKDVWTPPMLRGHYASYIASFVSRAKFAPLDSKLRIVESILAACEHYARQYTDQEQDLQQSQDSVFGMHSAAAKNCATKHSVCNSISHPPLQCALGVLYLDAVSYVHAVLSHPTALQARTELRFNRRQSAVVF